MAQSAAPGAELDELSAAREVIEDGENLQDSCGCESVVYDPIEVIDSMFEGVAEGADEGVEQGADAAPEASAPGPDEGAEDGADESVEQRAIEGGEALSAQQNFTDSADLEADNGIESDATRQMVETLTAANPPPGDVGFS
ncbi:MAG: hypothetical protein ACC661_05745, partial [Verrucomicrobiales bacterium]